jgi:hypothetical protein
VLRHEPDGFTESRHVLWNPRFPLAVIENRKGNYTICGGVVLRADFIDPEMEVPQDTSILMRRYPEQLKFQFLPERQIAGVLCYGVEIELTTGLVKKIEEELSKAYQAPGGDPRRSHRNPKNWVAVTRSYYIGKDDFLLYEFGFYDYLHTPIAEACWSHHQVNSVLPLDAFSVPPELPIKITHSAKEQAAEIATMKAANSRQQLFAILRNVLPNQTNSTNTARSPDLALEKTSVDKTHK